MGIDVKSAQLLVRAGEAVTTAERCYAACLKLGDSVLSASAWLGSEHVRVPITARQIRAAFRKDLREKREALKVLLDEAN